MENSSSANNLLKSNHLYFLVTNIVLYLVASVFIFFPVVHLNGETIEDLSLTGINLLVGGTIEGLGNLSTNIIFVLSFAFLLISFILFILRGLVFKDESKKKLVNTLTIVSISTLLISIFFYIIISYTFLNLYPNLTSLISEVTVDNYCLIFILIIYTLILLINTTYIIRKENNHATREIAETAMFVAIAVVLDKINIDVGATGGSINLSMVPLMIIGLRYGFIKGIIASSVYFGIITNLTDGWGIQFYPFDYFIGFLGYGSSGLFYSLFKLKNKDKEFNEKTDYINIILSFVFGSILAFIIRMIGGSLSSIIFYSYSIEEALIYNLPYVGISALVSLIGALLLAKPIQLLNNRYKVKNRLF